MTFDVKSHKEDFLTALKTQRTMALEALGAKCSGYAAMKAPTDTGRLKNSITWATSGNEGRVYTYNDEKGNQFTDKVGVGAEDDAVYIGTNVEYAPYQELGTSKTAPHPFLKPAAQDHSEEYRKIVMHFLQE